MFRRFKCGIFVLLLGTVIAEPQLDLFSFSNDTSDETSGETYGVFNTTDNTQQIQRNQQLESTQNNSGGTCGSYWSIQSDENGKNGLLSIPHPDRSKNVLKVQLTLAAKLPTKYFGDINLAKEIQSSVNDVSNGRPLTYRIRFPLQDPLPTPKAVYLNDQLICKGPKINKTLLPGYVTTIHLNHTLTTGLSEPSSPHETAEHVNETQPIVYEETPNYTTTNYDQTQQTFHSTESSVYKTTIRRVYQTVMLDNQSQNGARQFQCGVPDYRTPIGIGLVVGGNFANRGQFPWLAAYYHNGQGSNGFICGGSLVSTKIVVTAAHCVQNKQEYNPRKAEEATFYLGKYYLEALNSEQGFILSGVSQLVVHPQWNITDERFDADIAIAVLVRTIRFTKFIKPICLWTATSSYQDMIGRKGVIVGWGKTEFDAQVSDRPKWTSIPVVTESDCLRSSYEFAVLTSSRTFCAGDNLNHSPCDGDSGGGFIVNSGNKWYLRGIISASSFDPVLSMCDPKKFAVFTDVVVFNGWIQSYTQHYG